MAKRERLARLEEVSNGEDFHREAVGILPVRCVSCGPCSAFLGLFAATALCVRNVSGVVRGKTLPGTWRFVFVRSFPFACTVSLDAAKALLYPHFIPLFFASSSSLHRRKCFSLAPRCFPGAAETQEKAKGSTSFLASCCIDWIQTWGEGWRVGKVETDLAPSVNPRRGCGHDVVRFAAPAPPVICPPSSFPVPFSARSFTVTGSASG